MFDPSKFASLAEYDIAYFSIVLMVLSEMVIWIYTFRGNRGKRRKGFDKTIWLIILGWWWGITASAFFRSKNMPEFIRDLTFPHLFYYFGIVFIVAGVIIRCIAVLTLKHAFTLQIQTTDEQRLIKTGLYHFVRNPAYSGAIMSVFGVSLAYRSIFGTIFSIIVCLICYGIRIHFEERALKEQFQGEFDQYCAETKFKLIPGIY